MLSELLKLPLDAGIERLGVQLEESRSTSWRSILPNAG